MLYQALTKVCPRPGKEKVKLGSGLFRVLSTKAEKAAKWEDGFPSVFFVSFARPPKKTFKPIRTPCGMGYGLNIRIQATLLVIDPVSDHFSASAVCGSSSSLTSSPVRVSRSNKACSMLSTPPLRCRNSSTALANISFKIRLISVSAAGCFGS